MLVHGITVPVVVNDLTPQWIASLWSWGKIGPQYPVLLKVTKLLRG